MTRHGLDRAESAKLTTALLRAQMNQQDIPFNVLVTNNDVSQAIIRKLSIHHLVLLGRTSHACRAAVLRMLFDIKLNFSAEQDPGPLPPLPRRGLQMEVWVDP